MEWIIDQFGARPKGILRSMRYVRVVVDDNGLIHNEDVPGEYDLNLDRISDYKSNNRRYSPGQVITTFCNFNTFTRYTIIASNERPFAIAVDELNQPACGYQTPLPQPYVPFNPYGNLVYGAYKELNFCDWEGNPIKVTIEKKQYSGALTIIEIAGESAVMLKYKSVENVTDTIRSCEMILTLVNQVDFATDEFYTEDERTFRVTVEKSSLVEFKGYIIPDDCTEPFDAAPYTSTIRCTDGIGSLKTVSYPSLKGQAFNYKQSFIGVLCFCLAPTNLNLNISTICNYYSTGMPTGLGDDPLDLAMISPLRFASDKGEIMTCYEVLDEVCKAWGAYFVQADGQWNFVRTKELAQSVVRQRTYNYTGFRLSAQNFASQRIIGGPLN